MSKNVVIIPARWGSTRFPGKPLHQIAGKPLLWHVWERCRRARKIESTIIATDDMRIAEAAFAWGAEVALTSPKHQSGTDRIAEVAKHAKIFRSSSMCREMSRWLIPNCSIDLFQRCSRVDRSRSSLQRIHSKILMMRFHRIR